MHFSSIIFSLTHLSDSRGCRDCVKEVLAGRVLLELHVKLGLERRDRHVQGLSHLGGCDRTGL
jgi:hypothetical protein